MRLQNVLRVLSRQPEAAAAIFERLTPEQWDILAGATIKRTLAATTPAATYTAAQQTADFGSPQPTVSLRLYQLSATHGRGTPREATL